MKKFIHLFLPPIFGIAMLLALMVLAFRPTVVRAAGPWYVSPSGDDFSNDCLSPAAACQTIGGAIGKASSGDTINIATGTYTETNIISGKALTLVGAGIGQTIVDGGGSTSSIFTVYSNASANISGMTLQNGSANDGAAIHALGPITASHLSITNNTSNNSGSVYVYSTTLNISDSSISGNHTESGKDGIFADTAKLLISNSTLSGNEGQAIHVQSSSVAVITNSTISGNSETAIVVVSPSTVTINASTIANNSGYGIVDDGAVTVQNTILYHNDSAFASGTENNCISDYSLFPTSLGYNIDGGTSCSFSATGDMTNTNPLLLPLGDYGGNTQTHALSLNSPAIDAGSPTTCPATDQRGTSRPQDGDGDGSSVCDIGAFELLRQAPTSVTISGDTSGPVNGNQSFIATVSPITATQPVTYVWDATNQTPITHTAKGISDTVSFNWSGTGAQVITVTVNNGVGSQTDTHAFTVTSGTQAVTNVAISGATSGSTGATYTFNATVLPSNATQPITYSWQADGQSPVVHTGGTSDSVDFHWTIDGAHIVTVTAENIGGTQTATHTITLSSWYVNATSGNDSNDCLSSTSACQTIGGAIGKAGNGDTINIAAGTYAENLSVSKSLSFIGAGRDQTIVDGGASDSVFYTALNTDITLSDMTIQHGSGRGGNGDGGGIYVDGALTLSQVRIFSNTTGNLGGAIFINSSGSVTATNSTFDQNAATSSGGTIFVDGGTLRLESSTVANNNSESIHNQSGGTVDIFNSTISGNTGGIINGATMSVRNSTIANNSAGNAIFNSGTFTVRSSILAAPSGVDVCDATSFGAVNLVSQGYNLESTNTCGLTATGDITNTNPYLQFLADNGGDTWTHALLRPSPALDGSDSSVCPATDQRGTTRPIDGDGDGTATCDIGAFESPFVNWMLYLPLVLK